MRATRDKPKIGENAKNNNNIMSKHAKRKRPAEDVGKDSDDEDAIPATGDAPGNRQVRRGFNLTT